MNTKLGLFIAVAAIGAGSLYWSAGHETPAPVPQNSVAVLADVILPQSVSSNARIGQSAFDSKCAACHGANAAGQKGVAPPLVHKIYEPSHHSDEAFQRAVSTGVRGHHWPFGDMPPVAGLTRGDVAMIVAYVRELQQANGIH